MARALRFRGVAVRFVRNNAEDEVLMADLARLNGEEVEAPPADAGDGEPGAEEDPFLAARPELAPFADDSFVRVFVRGSTHVRRYAGFYAGGILWLLAVVLIQPIGGGRESAELASSGRRPAARAAGTVPQAAPAGSTLAPGAFAAPPGGFAFDDATVGGTGFGAEDFGSSTTFGGDDFAGASPDAGAAETSSGSDDTAFPSFDDEEFEVGPEPLSIAKSGYASATGGTPAEVQPPEGGLPVGAAAGEPTKISFVALEGTETLLRLAPVSAPGANVNAERARIRACPITTEDWAPIRGQALSNAPKFATELCVFGVREASGHFLFDLGEFGPLDEHPGFALVTADDPTQQFLVTFKPAAEPSPNAG